MIAFWHTLPAGVSVTVKVQPKSRRPGIYGRSVSTRGACLRIGVNEAAGGGRTNRATCAALAKALQIPASAVAVMLGQTSRDKTHQVAGDARWLTPRLEIL